MNNPGGILQWAVDRPVSVVVGVVLVILFGSLSLVGIPIQLTPDVSIPTVSVNTVWPGATPTEIETEILEVQEEALKSLPGLVRMTAQARRQNGTIDLELEVGTSLNESLVRVANLLSQVPDYPESAQQPVISTADATGPPLAVLIVRSEPPGREVDAYGTWLAETVVPQLERIRGVASVVMRGGQEQEVHIDFDPSALAARGVALRQLITTVRAEFADASAGDIDMGKRRYAVRTQVMPRAPRNLERMVIKTGPDGTPVLLGDVATVRPGLRKPESVSLFNGEPAIALLLFREAGFNVLAVTREIHRVADELQNQALAPEGLQVQIATDQTEYINGALDLVRSNLLLGGLLAVATLMLFLRSAGASVVVALSIPISVVGTMLILSLLGRTVNIVSLAGMTFAVGMVVDNSIVVLENIVTWRNRESSAVRASIAATREVWGALFASTCTTAVVFVPILTWQDEVGEILSDVALSISTAVLVSLVVSMIVIPSFAARFLRTWTPGSDSHNTGPMPRATALEQSSTTLLRSVAPRRRRIEMLAERIARTVYWIVSVPRRSVAAAVIGVLGTAALGLALLPPMEYLPNGNRNIVFGVVIPPPGYSVEETRAVAQYVQNRLMSHRGVDKDGAPALDRTFFVGSPEQSIVGAAAVDPQRVGDVVLLMRRILAEVPDVIGVANQGSLFGRQLGGGRAIEIDIAGTDLVAMTGVGRRLLVAVRKAIPGAQIRPIPGLDPGAFEFQIEPRRAQAARHGLSSADIGLIVDAYVDGAIIGELGANGEPGRNVILRARGVDVNGPAGILNAPVASPRGRLVPLSEIASMSETLGPTVIRRIERQRAITLQVSPAADMPFATAVARIQTQVAQLEEQGQVPSGVRIDYSGNASNLEQARSRFGIVLLLAVVIIFLVLAALLEDFLAPVAILVTVPLAGAGGVLCLRLVDAALAAQPLDIITATGFVILIGVVVNNAILIVDGALTRINSEGLPLDLAVAGAVHRRVRPIAMSTLTSLVGLLPLVLFPGSGSELYRGVGTIVLGGLALSTVLSLFLVPAVFTALWHLRQRLKGIT